MGGALNQPSMGKTMKDDNGTVWYANYVDVMDLPDLFAGEVDTWLNTDMDVWEKDGSADSMYFPIQAEDTEQLEARKETLENGIGVIPALERTGVSRYTVGEARSIISDVSALPAGTSSKYGLWAKILPNSRSVLNSSVS